MNRSISILGCGWYGLALAKCLVAKGYKIKGSSTTKEKLLLLEREGIEPFLVNFQDEDKYFDQEFFNSNVLIICIPPKKRNGEQAVFSKKIENICLAAKNGTIENILFISSTAVYSDSNIEINEFEIPGPATASGRAMVEAEELLQKEHNFNTTILRFSGLIGPGRDPGKFFAGKTDIPNGQAPVNLIHLKDCIGLSIEIIEKNAFGYVFNGCTPDHPARQDFYTSAALKSALLPPSFINELKNQKIIISTEVSAILKYKYLINKWADWLKEDKL